MPKKSSAVSKTSKLEIVILAAGLGTRMKSPLPKVLHEVCGISMLELLLTALSDSPSAKDIVSFNIVVGYEKQTVIDQVKKFASRLSAPVFFSTQAEQLGTAHAVSCALAESDHRPADAVVQADTIAVFNGDLPLFTPGAFEEFLAAHAAAKSSATMATTELPDATGYGRILRKGGKFIGSVEHKDASAVQRKIREFNGGVYLFDKVTLEFALKNVSTKNSQKEFYLPDVFSVALKKKLKIHAHKFADPDLLRGANNMKELAEAQKILYARIAERWMIEGVFVHDPSVTWIGPRVKLSKGVVIAPFSKISGNSTLAEGVRVGSHCNLNDIVIGERSVIKDSVVADQAVVGSECAVGPMAHFRPGTVLSNKVKAGNFVEIKKATLGEKTSVSHLSYVGDADIGKGVNLGCGFITCNYDGVNKHKTIIGDHVFVGSDSQMVAPIQIAAGTLIASGTTVTESVIEPDSLVLARTKQVTKPGYAKKYK